MLECRFAPAAERAAEGAVGAMGLWQAAGPMWQAGMENTVGAAVTRGHRACRRRQRDRGVRQWQQRQRWGRWRTA